MIPDDVVERVREQADIVQVIGEHVKLKRVGKGFRGPCPFHQGKDPNFAVSPNGYHCFVCHEKGDVFTFVQKRLGLDFVAAVKYVGEKAGVEVRDVSHERAAGPDPRERFWEMNAAAAAFFGDALWGDDGAPAREYLAGRDVDRAMAERFGLGFAPRDGERLRRHLEALGFDAAAQAQAGLLVVREEGEPPRPRFRHRLMFPISDAQGRVIAFGGRVIGEGEPKYLNSPESPTFQKGATLYGLHWARHAIRRDGRALLVEGYFDCIRLHAAGVECTVAPLGTALTEPQAALVRKYTSTVFLLYDSDGPGLKATFRAADLLLAQSCKALVVSLPEREDPDTFVRRHGREGLERHLGSAVDVLERKIQILERGGWFGDLRRKRASLDRLLPTIRAAADPITRSLYVARAAEAVGVSTDVLEREAGSGRPRGAPPRRRPGAADPTGREPQGGRPTGRGARPDRVTSGASAERELVRVLLHRRQNVERILERISPDALRDPVYALIAAALRRKPDAPTEAIAAHLDDEAVAVLNTLAAESGGLEDPARILDDCVAVLLRRDLGEQIAEIDRELPLASDVDKDRLVSHKQTLMQQIRDLGGHRWKSFSARQ